MNNVSVMVRLVRCVLVVMTLWVRVTGEQSCQLEYKSVEGQPTSCGQQGHVEASQCTHTVMNDFISYIAQNLHYGS